MPPSTAKKSGAVQARPGIPEWQMQELREAFDLPPKKIQFDGDDEDDDDDDGTGDESDSSRSKSRSSSTKGKRSSSTSSRRSGR